MPDPAGQTDAPEVAIVGGTGALGFGLALRLADAGVGVVLGSRDPRRAEEGAGRLAERLSGARIRAAGNAEAVAGVDIVVLCVPFRNQSETLAALREALREGQVVLDATVPLAAAVSGRATRMLGVWQGSAAQQAAEMVPEGVRVVSGLHTVSAAHLADLDSTLDEDVLLCGDRKADKAAVQAVVGRVPGLRCVDCGRLEMARITESLTALMISVNGRYKARAGVRLTGLPDPSW